jgi:uncharacterized linocin/CFP29 family protein
VFRLNWIAKVSTMLIGARTTPTGNLQRTPRDRSPLPRTPPYSTGMPPPALGARQGTSNPIKTLPADVREYPDAIAQSLSQLRLVGVNGPYSVLLGADAYTALAETSDHGYPVLEHVKRLVKDQIIWAPAIAGAFVLTTRGGDFELHIGQDVSIGYLNHNDAAVRLYLQETFTFFLLTTEAAVALVPPVKAKKT